jgi:hypothetical protein
MLGTRIGKSYKAMAGLHFTDVSNENIGSINGRKTESLAGLMQLPTKWTIAACLFRTRFYARPGS